MDQFDSDTECQEEETASPDPFLPFIYVMCRGVAMFALLASLGYAPVARNAMRVAVDVALIILVLYITPLCACMNPFASRLKAE